MGLVKCAESHKLVPKVGNFPFLMESTRESSTPINTELSAGGINLSECIAFLLNGIYRLRISLLIHHFFFSILRMHVCQCMAQTVVSCSAGWCS